MMNSFLHTNTPPTVHFGGQGVGLNQQSTPPHSVKQIGVGQFDTIDSSHFKENAAGCSSVWKKVFHSKQVCGRDTVQ